MELTDDFAARDSVYFIAGAEGAHRGEDESRPSDETRSSQTCMTGQAKSV